MGQEATIPQNYQVHAVLLMTHTNARTHMQIVHNSSKSVN